MPKKLKISCKGSDLVDLDSLKIIQGELKELSVENHKKLLNSLKRNGFNFPLFVWRSPSGENCLIDGTQRFHTLKKMRFDGWEIPPLPVAWIDADNYSDAKRRLLNCVSQYGEVTKQGFHDFFADTDFNWMDVTADIRLPEIDMQSFALENHPNIEPPEEKVEKEKCSLCGK